MLRILWNVLEVVRMEYVRIPMDRVGILIGKGGKTKEEIERRLRVQLSIDAEGLVSIQNQGDDVLAEWKARDIVRAISRGMNPQKAFKLASDDYVLELIELSELVGRSQKALTRQRGRIIGREGKTRKCIEESTGVDMSVYGKSVALIGAPDEVTAAKKAVLMLAGGTPHSVVYKVLQRKARELKEKRTQLWKS